MVEVDEIHALIKTITVPKTLMYVANQLTALRSPEAAGTQWEQATGESTH